MKKKWLVTMLTPILAISLVAGCGTSNNNNDPVDEAPTDRNDVDDQNLEDNTDREMNDQDQQDNTDNDLNDDNLRDNDNLGEDFDNNDRTNENDMNDR